MIMGVELLKDPNSKVVSVRATGKLNKEDYERLLPEIEAMVKECGKIRVLFEMHDFHGWTAGALWEDIKFDLKHFADIERLAIVGEKKWQEGMAAFCRPFTTATIKYFDHSLIDIAREWVVHD
jgi:stage II sporulation SpoAA-like protein